MRWFLRCTSSSKSTAKHILWSPDNSSLSSSQSPNPTATIRFFWLYEGSKLRHALQLYYQQQTALPSFMSLRERPHRIGSCTQKDEVQHSPGGTNIHLSKAETSMRLNHRAALEHIHFRSSDTVLTKQLSGLKSVSQK